MRRDVLCALALTGIVAALFLCALGVPPYVPPFVEDNVDALNIAARDDPDYTVAAYGVLALLTAAVLSKEFGVAFVPAVVAVGLISRPELRKACVYLSQDDHPEVVALLEADPETAGCRRDAAPLP